MRLFIFLSIISIQAWACDLDSIKSAPAAKARVKFTTRLHSLGYFSYSGRIISENPAMDFTFNYERRDWGLFVFKALDLHDHLTPNNFTLAMVYKNLHVGKRLVITPNVGTVLEQSRKIADKGSDVAVIVTTTFRVSKHLTIDNSVLMANLVLERHYLDCVSRLRFLYSHDHLDLTLLLWHNNKIFDSTDYFSGGINVAWSRMKVSNRIDLSTGLTGVVMMQTSDRQTYPKRNGLLFSLAMIWH